MGKRKGVDGCWGKWVEGGEREGMAQDEWRGPGIWGDTGGGLWRGEGRGEGRGRESG